MKDVVSGKVASASSSRLKGPMLPEPVNEKLSGDFWLVFKHNFFGPRTYVPFKDGKIVEDESEWVIEESRSRRMNRGSEQRE